MVGLWFVLKILHVVAVAVWLGGGLTAPGDIRRTLLLGPPHSMVLMPRLGAIARLMNLAAAGTVVTGAVLVLASRAWGLHRIQLGLVLTLLAVVVGRWMIRPVLGQIAQSVGRTLRPDEVDQLLRRFRAVNNLEHGLRVAVLVLMIYPFSF